jgi:hypothetical protein
MQQREPQKPIVAVVQDCHTLLVTHLQVIFKPLYDLGQCSNTIKLSFHMFRNFLLMFLVYPPLCCIIVSHFTFATVVIHIASCCRSESNSSASFVFVDAVTFWLFCGALPNGSFITNW